MQDLEKYTTIHTPSGIVLNARVVPHTAFSLGTQLDRFIVERRADARYPQRLMAPGRNMSK